MPAFWVRPKRLPEGSASNISGVSGSAPAGPRACVATRSRPDASASGPEPSTEAREMVAMGSPSGSKVGALKKCCARVDFTFPPSARDTHRTPRSSGMGATECYKACVPGRQFEIDVHSRAGLRRRWLYLTPVVFVTYSLAYLGRSNFGFGAAAGLARSLHFTESRVAFLSSAFFLGYFLFQVPAATYATRRSATRLVFFALISWGVLSGLTGVIRQYWLLVVDRLLLGVAESLILPSMLILLTHWFTRAERSRANAILILGNPVTVTWMAAVTGYLIKAAGWQMTFILEGIPSVLWAFIWITVARDRPVQAS